MLSINHYFIFTTHTYAMSTLIRTILAIIIIGAVAWLFFIKRSPEPQTQEYMNDQAVVESPVTLVPISHASGVLVWDGLSIYMDPVGGKDLYAGNQSPDIILLTDIHGDHLDLPTLAGLVTEKTIIVAPKAVADQLGDMKNIVVMQNGEKQEVSGFSIEAIPMYNVPESDTAMHTKGRGNGYVVEKNAYRVYISGDTGNTPEMRALTHIDLALVCMNLPYTMSVEDAAQAVLAFKPKRVTPYHYRGKDGLSDVNRFKTVVNEGDPSIEVALLDWYAR
jgi:L-ascorbate metabolism protein UlaG (beta-lactamase superfamily)